MTDRKDAGPQEGGPRISRRSLLAGGYADADMLVELVQGRRELLASGG